MKAYYDISGRQVVVELDASLSNELQVDPFKIHIS